MRIILKCTAVASLLLILMFMSAAQQRPVYRIYPGTELPASQVALLKPDYISSVNGGVPKEGHDIQLLPGPHIVEIRYSDPSRILWFGLHFIAEPAHIYEIQLIDGNYGIVDITAQKIAQQPLLIHQSGGNIFVKDTEGNWQSWMPSPRPGGPFDVTIPGPKPQWLTPGYGVWLLEQKKKQIAEEFLTNPMWTYMRRAPLLLDNSGKPLPRQHIEMVGVDKRGYLRDEDGFLLGGGWLFTLEGTNLLRTAACMKSTSVCDFSLYAVGEDRQAVNLIGMSQADMSKLEGPVRDIARQLAGKEISGITDARLFFTKAIDGELVGDLVCRDRRGAVHSLRVESMK